MTPTTPTFGTGWLFLTGMFVGIAPKETVSKISCPSILEREAAALGVKGLWMILLLCTSPLALD
jgi:hypothetical protein